MSDDLTMERVHLAVMFDCVRLELVSEFRLDSVQQRRWVAFDRPQIVTALVRVLTGDVLLAPHGIDSDQQPVDIQGLEEFRVRGYLIALAGNLFLAENDALFRARALTMWMALSPPLPAPRTVSPSTPRPPFAVSTTRATQRPKAAPNCFRSRAPKIHRNVSSEATPFRSPRK